MSLSEILLLLFLIAMIVIAIGWYFVYLSTKDKNSGKKEEREILFKDILGILKDENSATVDLESAVNLIKQRFPNMDEGKKEHLEAVFYLAKHKNATSKIILEFGRFLKSGNKEHEKIIDQYEKKGLDER